MPPRAPTAYFLFTAEVRADVHKELLATSSDGKVSVATVSKAIGEKWRHMSDEEKQRYKDLAAQKAAELNERREHEETENPASSSHTDTAADNRQTSQPSILPLSLVKRLATRDEEVGRISGDAVKCIAEATGQFLGVLAGTSYMKAIGNKRKNFKYSDIDDVARKDKRLVDMGLPASFDSMDEFKDIVEKSKPIKSDGKGRHDAKNGTDAKKMKSLESFFGVENVS